jgi:hypothetical protein
MLTANCEHCGVEFDATPRSRNKKTPNRFCSRGCKNRAMSRIKQPDSQSFMRPCERCQQVFDATPSRPKYEPAKKFCGACFYKGRGEQGRTSVERACQQCGKTFYVAQCHVNDKRHRGKYCSRPCSWEAMRNGTNNPASRKSTGGRIINNSGYIELFKPEHPYSGRVQQPTKRTRRSAGWVLEHRYVLEQLLGRTLLPTETVHHKDGNRAHNDPSNLELWVKPQPTGVRVSDLIAYCVQYHRPGVLQLLHDHAT